MVSSKGPATVSPAPLVPFELFPFEGQMFDRGAGIRMHYLDEGPTSPAGEAAAAANGPVVMVHGNPSWSFYYRNLVTELRGRYRAIVPDHVGCGYSDKPDDAAYAFTLHERINDLEALLEHLNLRANITLVMHDWGGMIGMGYAARHPERIARLIFMNTAAFHLPKAKAFPWALRLVRDTRLGARLVSRYNAFSRGTAWVGCRRNPMPAAVRDAYVAPYAPPGARTATLRFVQDIPLDPGDPAYPIVSTIEQSLPTFRDRPVLLCWGGRDFVFDRHFFHRFCQVFPEARTAYLADAGHYVLEDAAEDVVSTVVSFLEQTANPRTNHRETNPDGHGAPAASHAGGRAEAQA